jgi:hypothetical protein
VKRFVKSLRGVRVKTGLRYYLCRRTIESPRREAAYADFYPGEKALVVRENPDGTVLLRNVLNECEMAVTKMQLRWHFRPIEATHVCVEDHHSRDGSPRFLVGDLALFTQEGEWESLWRDRPFDAYACNLSTGMTYYAWKSHFVPLSEAAKHSESGEDAPDEVFREPEGGGGA